MSLDVADVDVGTEGGLEDVGVNPLTEDGLAESGVCLVVGQGSCST